MKDYAEEELGVTGGQWQLGDETDAHYDMNLGESGCRVNLFREPTYRGEPGISRQEMDNVMHLIATSKDLYNVLRKVEGQATPCEILTRDGYRDVYSVPLELIDEVKALLARLREATK